MVKYLSDFIKLVIFIIFSTILASIFRNLDFHESNFILIYVLSVVVTSRYTEGYFFGIMSSIFSVLAFNFFFTEPYYSFRTYRDDYTLTFLVMLIVAFITSMQTAKLKKEMKKSIDREKSIKVLYELNKSLLQVKNKKELIEISAKNISKILKRSIIIISLNDKEEEEFESIFPYENDPNISLFKIISEKKLQNYTAKIKDKTGFGTKFFNNSLIRYIPILKSNVCFGVIGIHFLDKKDLLPEENSSLEAIIILLTTALDKELLYEKQKNVTLEIEKERLRSNLLRSISHDLRTPLTSIIGSISTITNNEGINLSEDKKNELLQNVLEDATWLINSSENILSMTKIGEGKFLLNKNYELVSEILLEVMNKARKIAKTHKLELEQTEEDIFINIDGLLIIQLLYNIIENAIKYTPEYSIIKLINYVDEDKIYFEVWDNGEGIPEEDLEKIFNRFYRSGKNSKAEKRGLGLGLTICKSIAKAHNGELIAFNNEEGGATFRFTLNKERKINGNKTLSFNN